MIFTIEKRAAWFAAKLAKHWTLAGRSVPDVKGLRADLIFKDGTRMDNENVQDWQHEFETGQVHSYRVPL